MEHPTTVPGRTGCGAGGRVGPSGHAAGLPLAGRSDAPAADTWGGRGLSGSGGLVSGRTRGAPPAGTPGGLVGSAAGGDGSQRATLAAAGAAAAGGRAAGPGGQPVADGRIAQGGDPQDEDG